MSVQVTRRLFTVAEYNRMGEVGILTEDVRVELIEGQIVDTSLTGRRHAACVDRLTELLSERLRRRAIVRVQSPIVLNDYTEPQPDVALLRRREDFYERSLPVPDDVLLIIEVADTTLEYDRQIKVPLYARAGISEVWTINLSDGQVEVYTQPAEGAYRNVRRYGRGEAINSTDAAGLTLSVDEILG